MSVLIRDIGLWFFIIIVVLSLSGFVFGFCVFFIFFF